MNAHDLPDPSLNVMYGETAMSRALMYAKPDTVLVKTTLGAFREVGRGAVFFDGPIENLATVPLIVTLPAGRSIPVEIIDTAAQ